MLPIKTRAELEEYRRGVTDARPADRRSVSVCAGAGCLASGAAEVIAAFRTVEDAKGLDTNVDTRGTGCPGFCERGPVVVLNPDETCYLKVKPEDVPEIVEGLAEGRVVERLLFEDPATGDRARTENDIPFYRRQQRTLLESNIRIDSRSLDDYLAIGGYSALAKALFDLSPVEVIEEVKRSKIRGRGGAGFPAGRKWEGSRKAPGEPKYVIVNADEGDPGAFMDRALLEGNPHSILEGLIIGGFAVGAREG